MNAKEKANEIYNQFKKQIKFNCQPSTVNGVVKQCAIIHVKVIIDVIEDGNEIDYWQEVLTELNQM